MFECALNEPKKMSNKLWRRGASVGVRYGVSGERVEPMVMQEGKTTNVGGVQSSVLLFQRLLTGVVSACLE